MNIRVVANRGAILTKPLNGRPACLYATDCHRGCAIRANFQTPTVLLPPALASGRLEIRTRAMVYEVPVDKRGRVTGVRYIDVSTGAAHFVAARAVVLAASACETARILLNSKSTAFPNGLVNGSGQVGRNLTDSISTSVSGEIPALKGLPPFNDDGTSIGHVYIPWGALRGKAAGEPSFATEYHIHMFGGRAMPKVAQFHRLPHESGKPLYGQPLRQRIRRDFGCRLTLGSWGGMIPNADSRCEMDGDAKDRWGIPTLRFHWKLGQQEIAQARHARATMREMIEAMGGALYNDPVGDGDFIAPGGTLAHEIGTARMGAKATDSVLNAFGHAWEVRNLYVADGAAFTSHSDKNPTETILALAWRASDHLADSCIRKEI